MADLLLELFSEEIPARMQGQAAADLERLVVGALSDRGLMFEGVKGFAGPRRLTLAITGLPAKQPDVKEEKKGPRVGAPEKAIEGFLRSVGITLAQCQKQNDGKGEFYVAVIDRKGRATAEVLAEVLPEAFAKLPWPKSMRFPNSAVRWVRPLHSIVCTLDGEVVAFEFAGVKSGNTTLGHRFLSSGALEVRRFEDYERKLRDAHVVLDAAERKEIILHEVKQKAFALGLELIEDQGLLEEVAGLAEWPVVLIGKIEDQFMDVPPEILQTSMRVHQKYFSLRDPKTGKLANRFALVSNMVSIDGGKEIVAGNERVLRARLSDAKFFWDQDRKRTLESRVDDLKAIVFHAKLGTQYERVERIEELAGEIAKKIGGDPAKARRAARLCKADLTTGVVGEFPELQGVMGKYYALHDGENSDVVAALQDHYGPLGRTPTSQNAVTNSVALADKWDTISNFFKIGEKPTGSGDPYAIRRAALGVVKIILDRRFRLPIATLPRYSNEIMGFFAERLKVALRESGIRHDLIDAVFSLGNETDLVRLVDRVDALQKFLKTDDGANLLVAYRRAANILKAEEKKDRTPYEGEPDPELLTLAEEKALFVEMATASELIRAEIERERFVDAMGVMARLRKPVDAFFDKVTVNDKDANLRKNRLLLLSRLRATLHLVADFSKIEG
ncbi:MAG: glycine--tRNA ligase subunit beta [Proteobacteria bacterium]|nr:glycine--tRNA ligase subunit beta [Pseudomonadota bacterium]